MIGLNELLEDKYGSSDKKDVKNSNLKNNRQNISEERNNNLENIKMEVPEGYKGKVVYLPDAAQEMIKEMKKKKKVGIGAFGAFVNAFVKQ